MTTTAFKLAGGVEPASSLSKASKQNPVPQIFVSKITKAFLDALYSLLDGMVLLASDESPVVSGKFHDLANTGIEGLNPNSLELVDLKDGVCHCVKIYYLSKHVLTHQIVGHSAVACDFKFRPSIKGGYSKHADPARRCICGSSDGRQKGESYIRWACGVSEQVLTDAP